MKTTFGCIVGIVITLSLILLSNSTHLIGQDLPARSDIRRVPLEAAELDQDRIHLGWEFRAEGSDTWVSVQVPGPFEAHQGVGFNGVGWYRKRIPCFLPSLEKSAGKRLVLVFHGVATHATVFCDGKKVAEHLGGWTPFECDITEGVLKASPGQCELVVRVDELVGHNSQGFLPVFAPHFGGIWQGVQTQWRSDVWIDTKELFLWGQVSAGSMQYQIPIGCIGAIAKKDLSDSASFDATSKLRICLRYRLKKRGAAGDLPWTEHWIDLRHEQVMQLAESGRLVASGAIEVPAPALWSPETPELYEVHIGLERRADSHWLDWVSTQSAFREVRVDGSRILLNGRPLRVRGILNWGYAPPSTAPSLDPGHWQRELQLVKDYGFNLMKFCLWVPPKEYLQMADQMGVLVWIEYPTWHSAWTKEALPTLEREFDEFFCYDRNHPSVILRSLTCETGPSADLEVIRKLYDRCHERIPGSIVEDDSSWIQWNRIHDFYDDHPYGNNHTWVPTLSRLKQYIDEHGVKPLVLGEAIAADTWLVPGSLDPLAPVGPQAALQAVKRGEDSETSMDPFWFPLSYRDASKWAAARALDMGQDAVARLAEDSQRYAMLMRKYQIETLHRELPDAGYVVSVIRDFPFASMGLMDFAGQPKWAKSQWEWHQDRMLVVKTDRDRRSFWADEPFGVQVLGVSLIDPSEDSQQNANTSDVWVRWQWVHGAQSITGQKRLDLRSLGPQNPAQPGGPLQVLELNEPLPKALQGEGIAKDPGAVAWTLRVEIVQETQAKGPQVVCSNQWDFWQIQRTDQQGENRIGRRELVVHDSCSDTTRANIHAMANSAGRRVLDHRRSEAIPQGSTCVAQRLDESLIDWMEQGGRLMLMPDGQKGSLPISDQWFLRGGPIVSSHGSWDRLRRMIVELQHFDLAGPVVPDVHWLAEVNPLVMLWDNHDIAKVKTHGLVFASKVGRGVMFVNAMNANAMHSGQGPSPAGSMIFAECLDAIESMDIDSLRPMKAQSLQGVRDKLRERIYSLSDRMWDFRPDPTDQGLKFGWQQAALDRSEQGQWKQIAIGKHWEAQGYPGLDGWAWYRTQIQLPSDWPTGQLYLQVDGADDYFEAYVDGRLVGSAGDPKRRLTAFEQRVSFLVADQVKAGETLSIAMRVEDWQGAGGLFRPIRLSTTELSGGISILK
jgi:hypothetical protein